MISFFPILHGFVTFRKKISLEEKEVLRNFKNLRIFKKIILSRSMQEEL
jgi:hypothetical protein